MPDYIEDAIVYPAVIALSSCLCEEIAKSGLPEPCSCGPMVGGLVLDYCSDCQDGKCGGQAWVRVADVFPSSEFPVASQTVSNCNTPLAYRLEVGIVRCKPMGTNSQLRGYSPPTLQQNVDAMSLQLADMAAIRRAIQCCFGENDTTYIMGNYISTTPGGDCLGGFFSVTVWSV